MAGDTARIISQEVDGEKALGSAAFVHPSLQPGALAQGAVLLSHSGAGPPVGQVDSLPSSRVPTWVRLCPVKVTVQPWWTLLGFSASLWSAEDQ